MSRPQKLNDDSKIFRDGLARNLESTIQCTSIVIGNRSDKLNPSTAKLGKSMEETHSDGSIIKNHDQAGLKQKLVSKVKSWSSKDSKGLQNSESTISNTPNMNLANIALDLESLSLTDNTSEDNLCRSDLLRAKDSLENVMGPRTSKTVGGDAATNSKSASFPSSSQDRRFSNGGPYSDPSLAGDTVIDTTPKVMTWDPWNKLGRKNKKENKRRTDKLFNQLTEDSRNCSPVVKSTDLVRGDEPRSSTGNSVNNQNSTLTEEVQESYEYQPYRQNKKSVEFVNDVLVVYFTADEVITKATEPLKKELEQQIRNKEMRRGHVPCTLLGNNQYGGEDYMAAWFRK